MKPTKIIVDLSKPKGERETVVELTDEEIAEREAQAVIALAEQAAEEEAQAKQEADRQAGIVTLKSLGLTDDQISALLS